MSIYFIHIILAIITKHFLKQNILFEKFQIQLAQKKHWRWLEGQLTTNVKSIGDNLKTPKVLVSIILTNSQPSKTNNILKIF